MVKEKSITVQFSGNIPPETIEAFKKHVDKLKKKFPHMKMQRLLRKAGEYCNIKTC